MLRLPPDHQSPSPGWAGGSWSQAGACPCRVGITGIKDSSLLASPRPENSDKLEEKLTQGQLMRAVLCCNHVGARARAGREGVGSSLRQQISPRDAGGMDRDSVGRAGNAKEPSVMQMERQEERS